MYQTLQQNLTKIYNSAKKITTSDPSIVSFTPSINELSNHFEVVKQRWDQDRQRPQTHPRWQALYTEIHKQFRLIEVDLLFLRTARRPPTIEQRLRQLCDRLSILIDYCDTGIKLSQQIAPSPEQDVLPCSEQSQP